MLIFSISVIVGIIHMTTRIYLKKITSAKNITTFIGLVTYTHTKMVTELVSISIMNQIHQLYSQ
jgi:hypothetical protein